MMSRRKAATPPTYCLHKASGRAVVRIDGKDVYLGRHGSPESHDEYARVIAEWQVRKQERQEAATVAVQQANFNLTIAEVLAKYREFAQGYYSKDGKPNKEFVELGYAMKPLRELYGGTLIREFGPLRLKAVRQRLIDAGLCRGVVNHRVKRIKRFFRWAVSEELAPPSIAHGLDAVAGLRRGRTGAPEAEGVKPVDSAWVDVTVSELSPPVAAMVMLQRLTGMRPGEVVLVRPCDVDQRGEVWTYSPSEHKNAWRGRERVVPLGPKAQEVLRPFLDRDPATFCFSPAEAEQWRNEQRATRRDPNRRTKVYPCELKAREKRKAAAKRRKSKRPKRDRYDVSSYRRAINYAVDKINRERGRRQEPRVPKWSPLQLRHLRATEIRRDHGIEAAQVSLGHAQADVTQVYAERNLDLAIRIAQESG